MRHLRVRLPPVCVQLGRLYNTLLVGRAATICSTVVCNHDCDLGRLVYETMVAKSRGVPPNVTTRGSLLTKEGAAPF